MLRSVGAIWLKLDKKIASMYELVWEQKLGRFSCVHVQKGPIGRAREERIRVTKLFVP